MSRIKSMGAAEYVDFISAIYVKLSETIEDATTKWMIFSDEVEDSVRGPL